jgi:hypothetical protein
MQVFRLETPIKNKIEFIVGEKITDGEIPANSDIKYLDFEPPEGFFNSSDLDGAIAVYAPSVTFSESSGSKTEQQESDSIIRVVSYGFGAPLKDDDDITKYESSVREAQNRAQILITCAFRAVMDRREVAGSPSEGIEPSYDSGIDVGANKFPQSMQKVTPEGAMTTNRGLCIYFQDFKFKLDESAINEELGVAFAGSDNIETDTIDPI